MKAGTKKTSSPRITRKEGLELLKSADLLGLGMLADNMRKTLHPEGEVSFIIDRNINYTNVCINKCRFCAFYRNEGDPEAYILSRRKLFNKIKETVAAGGTQILIQGGLHPKLDFAYYVDLLKSIKENFKIHVHGFSPPEITYIADKAGHSVVTTLELLREAGLDSIPGGGAEILSDRVRKKVSPRKIGSRQWLRVMEDAHRIGMKTTATMMFGSLETKADIIQHLIRIRDLQEETHGFTAFIPWTYQPGNTELGGRPATAVDYLKTLALSRIMLDNIPNVQASWVTQGAKIAQVALQFGANDFGSTMIEENVVAAAGVTFRMSQEEIVRLIQDAGYGAAQRDTRYKIIKRYDTGN
ncbi:MAG TPA: dehypoxanthine futalosine cyclase [Nitrospiraceae bacterium]|nr:dehypoxanthine futalosine cyclase [Nitrospiraceae bacterium]